MSKIFGLQGVLTGKLGNTVFAVRNGVQLARQYQPIVMDAKTEAQVANRAKLKLLSQTAAAIAPVIAIPRRGLQSARNRFIKQNYEYTGYGNGEATIEMADILLTASYKGLPGFSADRSSGTAINVVLMEDASTAWDKVVYVVLGKTSSQTLMPMASLVVDEAGTNGTFPAALPYVAGDISVHAYGIKLNTVASRVMFSNLTVPTAESIAKIVASRNYVEGDMSLSETRGLFMFASDTIAETTGVALMTISVYAYNTTAGVTGQGGSVTGNGRYAIGATATLTATAAEGFRFVGWAEGSPTGTIVDNISPYGIIVSGSKSYYAVFEAIVETVTVNGVRSSASTGQGTITGSGSFAVGTNVTLSASPSSGSTFQGWYTRNGSTASADLYRNTASITVEASANVTFYAVFQGDNQGMDG